MRNLFQVAQETMKLFILGGTGRTGNQLTRQALDRGHAVTEFVRALGRIHLEHERLQIVQGDAADPGQIQEKLGGPDAVLSALGSASHSGEEILAPAASSTLEAMRRTNIQRLIVVSMALLFPDVGPIGPILRFFLRNHLRDSAAMERII